MRVGIQQIEAQFALAGAPIDAGKLAHTGLFYDVVPRDALRSTDQAIATDHRRQP